MKWISVKNGMPNDVTPVLVFGYCCSACHNIDIAEIEKGNWWLSGQGKDLNYTPSHWKPLPNPPKKK